jgi:acetolactate synthase small subunit
MVLATPVYDREGAVLLTAGTVFDTAMLEQMIRHGVKAVSVRVPDYRDEQTIAREMADIRARIETIFRSPGSDAKCRMREAVLNYRIENAR